MQNFRALGALPPDPHWPPAAPKTAPHCEFLATRLLLCQMLMHKIPNQIQAPFYSLVRQKHQFVTNRPKITLFWQEIIKFV